MASIIVRFWTPKFRIVTNWRARVEHYQLWKLVETSDVKSKYSDFWALTTASNRCVFLWSILILHLENQALKRTLLVRTFVRVHCHTPAPHKKHFRYYYLMLKDSSFSEDVSARRACCIMQRRRCQSHRAVTSHKFNSTTYC